MKRFLIVFLSATLMVSGCIGSKGSPPPVSTYRLEYEPPTLGNVVQSPCVLRVEWFEAPSLYHADRLLFREKNFVVDGYRYHRWESSPGKLISWSLARDLRKAGFCSAVLGAESRLEATHVLEGSINDFLEQDSDKGSEAVMSVNVTLAVVKDADGGRRILFQKTYDAREKCNSRTPAGLAEGMSRAAARISAQVLKDVYEAVHQS